MEAALAHDDSVAMSLIVRYPLACLPRVRTVGLYNAARSSFEATCVKDMIFLSLRMKSVPPLRPVFFIFFYFFLFLSLFFENVSLISPVAPPSLPPSLLPFTLSTKRRLLINERAPGLSRANPTFPTPSLTHQERNYRSHVLSCFFVLGRGLDVHALRRY